MKTTTTANKVAQWAIFILLVLVATAAFFFLIGEDDPNNPISLVAFLSIKTAALAVCFGCLKLGQLLDKHGMLPALSEGDE